MKYCSLLSKILSLKRITKLFLIRKLFLPFGTGFLISLSLISCAEREHEISITIDGLENSSVIVGYYFNNKMKPQDTIKINREGKGKINSMSLLNEGVYFIYLPNRTFFDFLINSNQDFSIETNLNSLLLSQNISGNREAELYLRYQVSVAKEYKELKAAQHTLYRLKKQTSEYNRVYSEITSIKVRINFKIDSLIEGKKESFITKVLQLSKELYLPVDIDDRLLSVEPSSATINNNKVFQQYKRHYFDSFDFNDNRLLYTPFITRKLDFYFKTVITQNVDSLIKESNAIIERANNSEIRKYLIKYFFNMASTSQMPGIDAMIVDLAENYYFTGKTVWVDSVFMNRLKSKVSQLKSSTLGQHAPDLMMKSSNEQYYRLSEVRAPITILLFWDPNCGHCKTQIPQIKTAIWDNYQKDGIKVFAVYTQAQLKPWVDFIDKHDLYEWINVYDPFFKTKFWELYNIHSTPSFYVLNEDKKIIYKMNGNNFNINQLSSFVKMQLIDN